MSLKKIAALAALTVLAGGLLPAGAEDRPAAASLIRKDLLEQHVVAETRARRNIFIRGETESVAGLDRARALPKPNTEVAPPPAAEETIGPGIRYIGYVATGRKVIGLILADGQAVTVAVGDTVSGGYTVQKISPESVELSGPDGRTRTVSIEGEKK